jgi:hypothetical protein
VTVQLVALFAVLLTAALLWEERSWQRKHPDPPADMPQVRGRCLCCPGAPMVDDVFTHSRLAHTPRALAPEDQPTWTAR